MKLSAFGSFDVRVRSADSVESEQRCSCDGRSGAVLLILPISSVLMLCDRSSLSLCISVSRMASNVVDRFLMKFSVTFNHGDRERV